jgi:8-amino-7-oxononanoate synthase
MTDLLQSQDADAIKAWMIQQLTQVLRVKPEMIDPAVPFMAMGLDSVAAVGLTADLEMKLKRTLPANVIADYPSIDELAEFLASYQADAHEAVPMAKLSEHESWDWLADLNRRHDEFQASGNMLYEPVVESLEGSWAQVEGRRMLLLSSYSYLGLNGHPKIRAAADRASQEFGTGLHAARLIGGTTIHHRDLELTLARLKGKEDAVVFSTGYMTNIMTIGCLFGEGDWVIGDSLNHACIVDGCQYSRARFVTYAHNNMEVLEQRLKCAPGGRKLIVVDGVFSMDGDIAPLPEIVGLARRYGALVMVDEAHSLGVLGASGRGIVEHFGLESDAVDLSMGTLSKALPSMGGYIAASKRVVTALKYNARGWIFSSAMPASLAASAKAAIEVMLSEPWRVERLRYVALRYAMRLRNAGFSIKETQTPIIPIMCATDEQAFGLARGMRELGVLAYPIVYPAVPSHEPRVRTTVNAAMSDADVDFAVDVLARCAKRVGLLA